MINFILWGICLSFVGWMFFVNVMTWSNHKDKIPKQLHRSLEIIAMAGYWVDVLFNIVYGSILFMDIPKELTLSERLRRILFTQKRSSYRWKLAEFVCRRLIEPWDWNHCGIRDFPDTNK